MADMNAKRLADQMGDYRLVFSAEFTTGQDTIELPVGPVQRVTENCQRMRMQQILWE